MTIDDEQRARDEAGWRRARRTLSILAVVALVAMLLVALLERCERGQLEAGIALLPQACRTDGPVLRRVRSIVPNEADGTFEITHDAIRARIYFAYPHDSFAVTSAWCIDAEERDRLLAAIDDAAADPSVQRLGPRIEVPGAHPLAALLFRSRAAIETLDGTDGQLPTDMDVLRVVVSDPDEEYHPHSRRPVLLRWSLARDGLTTCTRRASEPYTPAYDTRIARVRDTSLVGRVIDALHQDGARVGDTPTYGGVTILASRPGDLRSIEGARQTAWERGLRRAARESGCELPPDVTFGTIEDAFGWGWP